MKPYTEKWNPLTDQEKPLHWRKPRVVRVDFDLFHEDVTDSERDRVVAVMARAIRHEFQVLTKRPERMREYLADPAIEARIWHMIAPQTTVGADEWVRRRIALNEYWPLPNVWLGVSVENQAAADRRIPELLATPAAVRFLSCEPLLEPVQLPPYIPLTDGQGYRAARGAWAPGRSERPDLDWVIVGGESGPGARPCDPAWIRGIVGQCKAAGVPVFVKQLGSNTWDPLCKSYGADQHHATPDNHWCPPCHSMISLRDRKGGDPEEWPEDLKIREMPRGAA